VPPQLLHLTTEARRITENTEKNKKQRVGPRAIAGFSILLFSVLLCVLRASVVKFTH